MNQFLPVGRSGFILSLIIVAFIASAVTFMLTRSGSETPSPSSTEVSDEDQRMPEEESTNQQSSSIPASSTVAPQQKTDAPSPTSIVLPAGARLPSMDVSASGVVQEGTPGGVCWTPLNICTEIIFTDLAEIDSLVIRRNDIATIYTDADKVPNALTATLRDPVLSVDDIPDKKEKIIAQRVELSGSDRSTFPVTVEPGMYIMIVTGTWNEGTVTYGFKIEVIE